MCIFGTILNYVVCACAYLSWLRQQPDDATDVESTEVFEFSEGMKFGVVFKAGFITKDAVLSYGTFLIVTTLLGQVHKSFFRF